MANPSSENLYLLEFLVNDVTIDGGGKCSCQGSAGELCVCFQFLDNQTLKVCERDFSPDQKFTNENSRIGKSCIFSLTPKQAESAITNFDITVDVHKKGDPNKEEHNKIGSGVISIANLLFELLTNKDSCPVAKVLQDKFPLNNDDNVRIGVIDAYIRLSCYGKTIITQFQMNMEDRTVLFKDKEGRSLYRYRKRKSNKPNKIEDVSDEAKKESGAKNPNCPSQPCFAPKPGSDLRNPNCPSQPCFPGGFPPDFSGTPPCMMGPGEFGGFGGGPSPDLFGGLCPSPYFVNQPGPPTNFGMPPPYGGPQFGGFPPSGGPPPPPSGQNFEMFFSPTLSQQVGIFPIGTYDQQMGMQQQQSCQGPCSRPQ